MTTPQSAKRAAASSRRPRTGTATPPVAAPGGATAEVTVASLITELEQAREIAIAKKQPTPAIAAIMAKARLAGFGGDKPDTAPATTPPRHTSYEEAARRIAYVLHHAAREKSGESQS